MADGQKKNCSDRSARGPEFKNCFEFISIAGYSGEKRTSIFGSGQND